MGKNVDQLWKSGGGVAAGRRGWVGLFTEGGGSVPGAFIVLFVGRMSEAGEAG